MQRTASNPPVPPVASAPPASGVSDVLEQRRRLILLSGTAGTGKRSVAAFLVAEHGFRCLDLSTLPAAEPDQAPLHGALAQTLGEGSHDLIVTCPAPPLALVALLRTLGFEWIWFDSDHGAARPLLPVIDGGDGEPAQLGKPRFVETFEASGAFRPLDAVSADLL